VHGEGAGIDQPRALLGLVGVREVAAEDRERRKEHALAVHPDVRRVKGKAPALARLHDDDGSRERPREKGARAERVLAGALDDEVGIARGLSTVTSSRPTAWPKGLSVASW